MAAERAVLAGLMHEALPTTRAALMRLADSLTASREAAGVDAARKTQSLALGARIGADILQWAERDGFATTRGRPYAPPAAPGQWRNDAPATTYTTQNLSGASQFIALDNPANHQRSANTSDRGLILSRPKSAASRTLPAANIAGTTEPYWAELRPFVLSRWDTCAIDAPPAYSTDTASVLAQNAREVARVRAELTEAQRLTALYWADNAGESGTPVGHWLSIASQHIGQRHLSAKDAAQVVLVTAIAQADAFLAAWGYKFRFLLVRPRTYIRAHMDSTWEPLIPTPPFPEYPSGHSTQSMAAATVLTAALGEGPFTDSTSIALGHAVRAFPSLRAASEEAGASRVYGGIHFPVGNLAGRTLGACVGTQVAQAFGLRPLFGAQ